MLERVWSWWKCKLIQPLWQTVWRFLKKLGIKPPYDPAIPLLGIYPEETKIEKDTCIPLFITALFTTARTWKQPREMSINRWMDKEVVVHIHDGILLSHKKECIWVSSNDMDEPRTYFTYGNVSFHVTLSIHLTLSSPLPMSISLFSMSVSPVLPSK